MNYSFISSFLRKIEHYACNILFFIEIYLELTIYEGVHLVEQFIPGCVFTFHINGKFHIFQNYTLTYAGTDICPLFPHLAPLHTHYEDFNYQSFVNLFLPPDLALKRCQLCVTNSQ